MNPTALQTGDHVNSENPWPGLAPYQTEDSAWFRGRHRELEDLVRRIEQNSLTVLFSRSGIGKSSLLRAALIPRLRRDAFLPIYVRLDFPEPEPALVGQIWDLLDRHVGLPPRYQPGRPGPRPALWEFFHDQVDGLLSPALSGITPVLVFDQFEEIFTLGEKSDGSRAAVEALLADLADLAEGRPPAALQARFDEGLGEIERFDFDSRPGRLLLALREDYLSHLERHRKRLPMVMENRMPLNPLNGLQALDAVVGPAPHLLDGEVAEQIVRFVGGDAASPLSALAIDPSLLNLICRELNNRRRALGQAKLTAGLLGGSREEILEGFYDGCFAGLGEGAADFVERELLTRSGHRESLSEERAVERIGLPAVEQLVNRRLLSVEERGGVRRVELSHDLLTEVASRRRDERLLREEAERQEAERRAYERRVEEARRKQRRLVRVAAVMGLVGLAACAAAAFALVKEREARQAREQADRLARENARRSSEADFLLASEYQRTGKTSLAIAHFARSLASDRSNLKAAESAIGLLLNPSTDVGWLPEFPVLNHDKPVRALSWNPGPPAPGEIGRLVTVSGSRVTVWRVPLPESRGGAEPLALDHRDESGHGAIVRGAVWSPDGNRIASWAADLLIRLWDGDSGALLHTLKGHTDTVNRVAFHPDGSVMASASYDHRVRLWDTVTGAPVRVIEGHGLCVNDVAFSPDGGVIASASDDGSVRIWDPASGAELAQLPHGPQAVISLGFGSEAAGPRLWSSGQAGLRWWDWRTGREEAADEPAAAPAVASVGPDGRLAAVATPGETALLSLAASPRVIHRWPIPEGRSPEGIAFSPEGRRLARWSGDILRIWGTDSTEPFGKPLRVSDPIEAAAWSPDTRRLAVASGQHVTLWDASERPPLVVTVPDVTGPVTGAVGSGVRPFPPTATLLDGARLVGTTQGNAARIWSAATGVPAGREIRPEKISDIAAFSPDGRLFAGCIGSLVVRYDTRTGRRLEPSGSHDDEIQGIAFSGDGRHFVTASIDRSAKVWRSDDGALVRTLRHPDGAEIASARFSPDGKRLVFIGYNSTAYLADLATGEVSGTAVLAHEDRINSAEFSPCGRHLVTTSDDGTAAIWRVGDGAKVHRLGDLDRVYRAAFSADSAVVATLVRNSDRVDLWSVATGRPVGKSLVHDGEIKAFSFSSGNRIITASTDRSARIWDVATGEPIGGPLEHPCGVIGARFSADGTLVVTTGEDGRARVWETFAGGPLAPGAAPPDTPPWLPEMLRETTAIQIDGTSQEAGTPPSSLRLRESLTRLSLPWSLPFLEQPDHYARAAAWLSLDPMKRPGAFGSRRTAEEEKADLLASINAADVMRAFQLGPHEGPTQAAVARFETDLVRSEFLIRFALSRHPDDPETVFQVAQALEKRGARETDAGAGDLRRARALLEAILQRHPGNANCLRALGWLMAREGDAAGSVARFEKAVEASPDDAGIREYYGFALSLLGRPAEALDQWLRAEALSLPEADFSDVRAGIAIGQWHLGRRDEALQTFRLLIETDPNRDWTLAETIRALTGEWTPEECETLSAIQAAFLAAGSG